MLASASLRKTSRRQQNSRHYGIIHIYMFELSKNIKIETAMGQNVDAQNNEESEYVKAITQ